MKTKASQYALQFHEMYMIKNNPRLNNHRSMKSLNDFNQWDDFELKEKVIDYMRSFAPNRHISISLRMCYRDTFTDEKIPVNGTSFTDSAGWYWTDESIYYADVYNIAPEEEFVTHVQEEYDHGFQLSNDCLPLKWRN